MFKARRKGEGFGGRGAGAAVVKESGLHQLYLLANSLMCNQASGDREVAVPDDMILAPVTIGNESSSISTTFQLSRQMIFKNQGGSSDLRGGGEAFTDSELKWIREFALQDGRCLPLLVQNFCPAICGHELVKAGLLLGLFGGTRSSMLHSATSSNNGDEIPTSDGFKIRADIHILGPLISFSSS